MKTDHDLTRRLSLAAYELRAQTPPAPLLAAIHRRLDRGRWKAPPSRARWFSWFGWAGLSTAAVAIAAVLVVHSMVAPDESVRVVESGGFVRLVSADEWQRAQADSGRTWLVSTEMPQARLAALGLPYDPAHAGARVPAELLLHSSGEVLAVRVTR
jgi:hypothetical protein